MNYESLVFRIKTWNGFCMWNVVLGSTNLLWAWTHQSIPSRGSIWNLPSKVSKVLDVRLGFNAPETAAAISKRSVRTMLLRFVIRWIQTYRGDWRVECQFWNLPQRLQIFLSNVTLELTSSQLNWSVQFKRIALHKNHVAFLCIKISLICIYHWSIIVQQFTIREQLLHCFRNINIYSKYIMSTSLKQYAH